MYSSLYGQKYRVWCCDRREMIYPDSLRILQLWDPVSVCDPTAKGLFIWVHSSEALSVSLRPLPWLFNFFLLFVREHRTNTRRGMRRKGKSKWKTPSTEDHSLLFSHVKYTQCRDRKWINSCLGVGQNGLGGSRNRKWLFIGLSFLFDVIILQERGFCAGNNSSMSQRKEQKCIVR